jgi:F0F1-type ATP synthase assembly protein I
MSKFITPIQLRNSKIHGLLIGFLLGYLLGNIHYSIDGGIKIWHN